MSPISISAAGVVLLNARAPVSMAGAMDPDRKISGVIPRNTAASANSTQTSPATAPTVRAISRSSRERDRLRSAEAAWVSDMIYVEVAVMVYVMVPVATGLG